MTNNRSSIFLAFLAFFILVSCTDRLDKRNLIIYNNSNKTIYTVISSNDSVNFLGNYDDFEYKGNYIYTKERRIKAFVFLDIAPNVKTPSNDKPNNWDLYFESSSDKKIRLFFIYKHSVDKYGWKEIFKNNIYDKKYYLTIDDLNRMNWQIEFKED